MAVAAGVLSDTRRRTLEAVCDTFAPSVESRTDDEALDALMARAASELGVAAQVEDLMAQAMVPEEIEGFGQVLDALGQHDFAAQTLEAREQILEQTAQSSHDARLAVTAFKNVTFLFFYGLPDPQTGKNPNWEALGYPGPISAPPSPDEAPKTIKVEEVSGESAKLTADAVVVGSGAGGAVIAAELQQAGKSVVVLEMGAYRNEQDFKQYELMGLLELYLGGGLLGSEDGSLAILAGSTLGGGTVVNYMNCIRTPEAVRRQWAEHGLEGLDDQSYERHVDAIWQRLAVNDEATSQNRTHRRLIGALDALGYPHRPITRNADRQCDDPRVCGYCAAGCQRGCKLSTLKTFLQDAADAGTRFVVGCRAERVLTEDGRARGVEATVTHADGSTTALTVEAPIVVVAGGSIESPALLLRSGIGGRAVGKNLYVHPASVVEGVYEEAIEGWIGQIQSEVSDQFEGIEGEWGFLIEGAGVSPVIHANSFPFEDGASHKRFLARVFRHNAPFISVDRDHGSGEVVLDAYGRPVVRWSLSDEVDRRIFVRANVELARLHRAAGAKEIFTLHSKPVIWREGEDFDAFLRTIEQAPYGPLDVVVFSAHQMGTCRMGADPETSVADGRGELHDVEGVWIGDASAFPTPSGVNPMISIMALAHRTAGKILETAS